MRATRRSRRLQPDLDYPAFQQLDGSHPWREQVPEGLVLYPVRRLSGGQVSYFNFDLAKEMGLIPANHPHSLNRELTETILSTFCLRIINEYDQKLGLRYSPRSMKPGTYMATRYLQMQHLDKAGRTSGDGRAIWNGVVRSGQQTWDVSSRGTGVTCLAPGAVQAGQPLQSGNTEHGYGCGLAEIDELFGAAILAEIFHRNNIPTERVLAIIDLGKGVGIGVRAAPNLTRPAHLFLFLKQGKLEPLRRAVDYFIDRQLTNGSWKRRSLGKRADRYDLMLEEVTKSFARFAGRLDRDYIFAWLEWDGDNVLADAGIIDYGSVRQFGLRHDQYRYDDVDRYSTNLSEQRQKAREIVQTFAQIADFLKTGRKKPWSHYRNSPWLKRFDTEFKTFCLQHFLYQIGLPEPLQRVALARHGALVENLFNLHSELERVKTRRRQRKVADGLHRPAVLNMRRALLKMAEELEGLPIELAQPVEPKVFFDWILSRQASQSDRHLAPSLARKLRRWQDLYLSLLFAITTPETWEPTLAGVALRAARINHGSRITGNALIHIVDEILRYRRRGLTDAEVQAAIEELIAAQTLNPDYFGPQHGGSPQSQGPKAILRSFLAVVEGFQEDI